MLISKVQGGPFDGTEKGPLDGTEMGCLDGTAVRFSANFFRKRVVSMVQLDFQNFFSCIWVFIYKFGFYFLVILCRLFFL